MKGTSGFLGDAHCHIESVVRTIVRDGANQGDQTMLRAPKPGRGQDFRGW
jgi:hypothetical protein